MLLFDTIDEYDTEITFVRAQMQNAVKAKEFRLNTSQSNQAVTMDMQGILKYLQLLTRERKALSDRISGKSVTSMVPRRCY